MLRPKANENSEVEFFYQTTLANNKLKKIMVQFVHDVLDVLIP
jgi:hypothetical protein